MAEVSRPYVRTPELTRSEIEDKEFMKAIREFNEEALKSRYIPEGQEGEFREILDYKIEYDEYEFILE